jgi:hypothetical protein
VVVPGYMGSYKSALSRSLKIKNTLSTISRRFLTQKVVRLPRQYLTITSSSPSNTVRKVHDAIVHASNFI